MKTHLLKLLLLTTTVGRGLLPPDAAAAETISYTGGILTEDFDSMGPAGTNTPPGWFAGYAGPTNLTNVAANDGRIAPNGTAGWNFGPSNGTDRALGTMATSTGSPAPNDSRYVEARIRNDSGQTIPAIAITYAGEQWRTGSSTSSVTRLALRYSADGVNFTDLGTAFGFAQPTLGPASVALDGNAHRVAGLGGIYTLPAPAPAGATVYLRWFDANDANITDPALAIDDVSFSASTSQPLSLGLAAPANGQLFLVGDNASIAVTNTGSISSVAFLVDGQPRFVDFSAPYEFVLSDLTAGPHTLLVIATDNGGLNATSAPVAITVTNPPGVTVLVANGSVWKYRDDGSGQGTAWRAPGFNDGGWNSGPAELGFGDSSDNPPRPERTVINGGPANNRHVTTYFRHTFNVPNPGAYSSLLVRLLRDDGGVVYLNGVEVLRSNIDPTNPIDFTTLATNAADDGTFFFSSANLSPTLLVAGPNVLAVEIHQTTLTSSDLSFDAMLLAQGVGNEPPVIQRQPQSATVTLGQPVTFMVTAVGGAPLIYQWFFNGTALPGATSAQFNLGPAEPQAAGNYTVQVSNPFGSVVSAEAALAFAGNAPINEFNVWVTDAASLPVVRNEIETRGGVILEASPYFLRLSFSSTPEAFVQIAALPTVLRAEPAYERGLFNFNSRFAINALNVQAAPYGAGAPGLTGVGVVAGVWDGGTFGLTHVDYASRLTAMEICGPTTYGLDTHAAHVTGTMAGDGIWFNNTVAGLAPQATIKSWSALFTCGGFSAPTPQTEVFNARNIASSGWPAPRIDLSQNSWGYLPNLCSLYGAYLGDCADYDKLVRQETLPIFFAAGNFQSGLNASTGVPCFAPGFGTVLPLGTAKNVVSVGAINVLDALTTFSGCGPTADGRLKPDVVAFGENVYSTSDPGWQAWPPYLPLSGTSMATPAVSGTAALLLEQFSNLSLPSPTPALIKALLCNTATDLGNTGPDFQYGYGKVNAEKAVDTVLTGQFDDVTGSSSLTTGGVWTRRITVPQGCELRVMVAWSDKEYLGANPQAKTLINDLDLELADPSSGIYLPLTLNPSLPTALAVPAVNTLDNVEQVVIGSAPGGNWTVVVKGTSVPQGPQEFAVTWCVVCPAAACVPQPIQGLWNTGLDLSGNPLPPGAVDPHYALIAAPTGTGFTDARHDYFGAPWVPDGPSSFWLQPGPPSSAPNGTYIYELTFDLGTCDPSTASITGFWAADDWATLKINNVAVPAMNAAFGPNGWASFSITSGFISGPNTIQFVVQNIGGGPTGLRVELGGTVCCSACIPKPPGLVAWWPLDEPPGATSYAELINGVNATIYSGPLGPPITTTGPQAMPGKVAGASFFPPTGWNWGQASDSPSLNFSPANLNGSFSVDCWIGYPAGVAPSRPIVDKYYGGTGYKLFLTNPGNLVLELGDGSIGSPYIFTSTAIVPSSPSLAALTWHFIGVSVDRTIPTAQTVTFYIDNNPPETLAVPPGFVGSTVNTADLYIGWGKLFFIPNEAALDEIELFDRPLKTPEMTALWAAGSSGKCKPCGPPTLICAGPKTVQCGAPIVFDPPITATDKCCGGSLVTVITSTTPLTGLCPQTTTRTWTVTDCKGNTATCSQTITVLDTTPPVFAGCPAGPINLPCNPTAAVLPTCATVAALGITASDVCSGNIVPACVAGPVVVNGCQSSQNFTLTATDACGNTATCTVTYNWTVDTTPPVFVGCPIGPVNLGNNPAALPTCAMLVAFTATDTCSGNIVPVCVAGPVVVNGCQHSQSFTLTAADACGNTATCTVSYIWTMGATPPSNDQWLNAIPVSAGPMAACSHNICATPSPLPFLTPAPCGWSANSPDVWYTYTPTCSGRVMVDTCGLCPGQPNGFDTVLSVYTVTGVGSLTEVPPGACNDDDPCSTCGLQSRVSFNAKKNVTYYIRVAGFNNQVGYFRLNITATTLGPSNDLCANATPVTAVPFTTCDSTVCATPSAPGSIPPLPWTWGPQAINAGDVWYTFKPPCSGLFQIDTCGNCGGTCANPKNTFDTVLSVYSDSVGLGCGLLTPVTANDNPPWNVWPPCSPQSRLSINGKAGVTYYIRVASKNPNIAGDFQLNITQIGPSVKPLNDLCVNATVVSAGTHPWNNCGANTDGPAAGGCPGTSTHDVWFSYTPASAGLVSLSTCQSGIDTVLAVYSGVCGTASFTQLGCNDNALAGPCAGSQQSYLTFNAAAGVNYKIRVGSKTAGVTGSGLLTILGPNPPAPTCPPAGGQLFCRWFQVKGPPNGTPWAWTITAPGCANISDLNVPGVPAIPGNDANTLAAAFVFSINTACGPGSGLSAQTFPNPNFPGLFRICATCPTATPFQLAVGPLGSSPANQCVVPFVTMVTPLPITGGPCNFNPDIVSVAMTQTDWNNTGMDDGIEIMLGTSADANGNFIPDETEACLAPELTLSPEPKNPVQPGENVVLTVDAKGTAPFSFQWSRAGVPLTDGGNVSGAQSSTLTIQGVTAADLGDYSAVVTNACGAVDTGPIWVFVETAPRPVIAGATFDAGMFSLKFDTKYGIDYAVEFKDTLADPEWKPLATVTGNGLTQTVTDPGPLPSPSRYYRLRKQ